MAMLDVERAAERIGVHAAKLKRWRNSGTGPAFIRLSHKTVVYDSDVLDEYLRSRIRKPSVQAFMEDRGVFIQESR